MMIRMRHTLTSTRDGITSVSKLQNGVKNLIEGELHNVVWRKTSTCVECIHK